MNNAFLVGTNVLIFAVDEDSRFHDGALNFLSQPEFNLFTTSKNISEFLVVLTRQNEVHLSTEECLDILDDLLVNITVLYPNQMTTKVFYELVRKYNPRGLWIHDVEIASIAIAYGIFTIATNNVADFNRIKELEIEKISEITC